ncbi:hypothetical protein MJD09_08440 [bacterium]|nr:hypothetical protein [bacterium]
MSKNIDFVRLPGLVNGVEEHYQYRSLNLDVKKTLKIRRRITQGVIKTFKPDLMLIDQDPLSMPEEMNGILSYVKEKSRETKIIWALPDILGDSKTVAKDLRRKRIYSLVIGLCDEIWVYGSRDIFDQIGEYALPDGVANKLYHIHYLQAPPVSERVPRSLAEIDEPMPFVLLTLGSGQTGFSLADAYFHFLENLKMDLPFRTLLLTGPMMPSSKKDSLKKRAEKFPQVIVHRFSKHYLEYVKNADLVVSNGGHNSVCEIISYGKKAILVPSLDLSKEHLIRSRIFDKLGRVTFLHPKRLTPQRLGELVMRSFSNGKELKHQTAMDLPMDGLENALGRIKRLSRSVPSGLEQAA